MTAGREAGDGGITGGFPQRHVVLADFFYQFPGDRTVLVPIQVDVSTQVVTELLFGVGLSADLTEDVLKDVWQECFAAESQGRCNCCGFAALRNTESRC